MSLWERSIALDKIKPSFVFEAGISPLNNENKLSNSFLDTISFNKQEFKAGFSLSYPWQQRLASTNIKKNALTIDKLENEIVAKEEQIAYEVRSSYNNLVFFYDQYKVLEKIYYLHKERLKEEYLHYETGRAHLEELIACQQDIFFTKQQIIKTKANFYQTWLNFVLSKQSLIISLENNNV